MRMKALHRKALRDLWHMRGQALAIAMVIASGIAMLVMSAATLDSLQDTRDRLYRDYRFSDVWAQVKRAPEALAQRVAELPGVNEVETRLIAGAKVELPGFHEPIEAVVQSLPDQSEPAQNRLYLRSGRMLAPFADDEVLVSESFAQAQNLKPGDRLRATVYGRTQWFTIVGMALSPEYVYQIKPGAMFPDYQRYAILWMNRRALAAALDMNGAFNQVVVRLSPGANERDTIAAMDLLLARNGSLGAHGRMDQLSYRFLHEEFRQLATMTRVFPTIFLGVAAFLLNVVFTRLVGTQRDQVAILKAFGYSTMDVALHYGLIVTLICLLGSALGVAGGAWLGTLMAAMYQTYFRFPFLDFNLSAPVVLAGIGVSLVAALLGTGRAVYAAADAPVAEAMRPPAPDRFRRSLAEAALPGRWLSQPTRIILRQIERRPFKALLTVLGLACAGAIMMMARFQDSAINTMVELQFRLSQQHDVSASFIEPGPHRAVNELRALPGVRLAEGFRSVPVRFRSENRSMTTSIEGLAPQGELRRPIDAQLRRIVLPEDGLVLNDYLAARLGVGVGDQVWVEVLEGRRQQLALPVARLVREHVGLQAYMNLDALNRALGDGDLISGALLTVDDGLEPDVFSALDRRPRVIGAGSRLAAVEALYKSIAQMTGLFMWISVLMGAIINFGVVYNSARIALAERGRELASLRVLGFTQGEVSYILLGELALLVAVSIPLSFAVGYGLSWYLAHNLQSDLYRVPMHIAPSAYAFAALTTVVSAVLSALAVRERIHRLDLIGVLKTRE
jgi:putative ABC transport system permease protein